MEERGRLMRRAADIPDGLDVDGLMRAALDLTRNTFPHPNPRVGAVLVSPNHVVLSHGACMGDGLPHAEANALSALQDPNQAKGATAVVTLEPCSHHGRTPPCADALVDAGVGRVVVGCLDPDPRVRGRGVEILKEAGIEVLTGVLADEIEAADPGYFHHRRTGYPLVTLKVAATIDGQAGALDGTSQWITGPAARDDAHMLRAQHDAVLVGAGTAIADNPRLTVRVDGYGGPQPRPIVLVGDRELPTDLHLMDRDPLIIGARHSGRVDIHVAMKELGDSGMLAVLVEGGPTIARAFLDAGYVDRIVWYVGAKVAGGAGQSAIAGSFDTLTDAIDVVIDSVQRLGSDVRIDARLMGAES
jgi:diaminohydroxyphosphoribosylaminopyrimidine deaminase/5-amino-6-(5-phosphoribosylamino)uracil reductase